ncbi:MAG: hypothetical protein R2767_07235 [Chitinophagales bacterium]
MSTIKGFSKLSRTDKIAWLAKHFLTSNPLDIARNSPASCIPTQRPSGSLTVSLKIP